MVELSVEQLLFEGLFLNLRNFHVASLAAFHIFAQLQLKQTTINSYLP